MPASARLALLWLRLQPHRGLHDTMFLLIVIWGTDIGAYLVGRVIGGAKLAPRISPGKTWSGSIGGLGHRRVLRRPGGRRPARAGRFRAARGHFC